MRHPTHSNKNAQNNKQMHLSSRKKKRLVETVKRIFADGKGLLATDESVGTLGAKFERCGIANTRENRDRYRRLLYTAPGLTQYLGGVILNEEAFQPCGDGPPAADALAGPALALGVKLDAGTEEAYAMTASVPGQVEGAVENYTLGKEELGRKLRDPRLARARFAKWRSLFRINGARPTGPCIRENIRGLCVFARQAQRHGLVPVVEPELYWEGTYDLDRAVQVARRVYSRLLYKMNAAGIYLPGAILKLSMLTAGKDSLDEPPARAVSEENYAVITATVPPAVGGVVFLSGGHPRDDSFAILRGIKGCARGGAVPLSYSFARALTDDVVMTWSGKDENVEAAQKVLLEALEECSKANRG